MKRVPATARRGNLALAVVAAGVFLAALDQTMVVTVLPSILRDLHISFTRLDDAAWIVTGYLLGYTVAMPLFGRIADVHGRRLMYLVSLAIFAGGSVLCVFAGGLQPLVAARIVQAAGGGAVVPIAMALAADLLPARRLALAIGLIGAAGEAGGVLGPLYGAILAHQWGWRSIFLVNVPLSVLLAVGSWYLLPREARTPRPAPVPDTPAGNTDLATVPPLPGTKPGDRARERVDYAGAALLALALAGLTIGLGSSTQSGGVPVRPWWLAVSAVALATFIAWEIRVRQPLVRLGLFRKRSFAAANVANFAVGAALIVGMVEIPLYAYSLLGMGEVSGGLLLLRMTVMIPVGALVGGAVAGRLGYRATGVAGFALITVGYLLVSRWPDIPSNLRMTLDLLVTGLGFGLVIAPIGASVIESVGTRWSATGSAVVTVMRMIGMMVGLASLSSWGLRRFDELMAGTSLPLQTGGMSDAQYQALTKAYEHALEAALHTVYSQFFAIAAVVAALAIIPALLFRRRTKGDGHVTFVPQ